MKELEHSIGLLIDSLGAHPIVGTAISLITASFGMMLNGQIMETGGIPDLIKDIFQMSAWTCTIIVSLLTIIGWLRKHSFTTKKKKK